MDTVKRYALLIGSGLVGILMLYLLLTLLALNYKYEKNQQALTAANAANQVAQTDATKHVSAISELTLENALLLKDNRELASQLQKTNQQKLQLTAALSALNTQLNHQLAEATDEHTKTWRADYVPVDAVQLLQRAATSALCAGTSDPLCADAGSVTALVPHYTLTPRGGRVSDNPTHAATVHEQSATARAGDRALR
jgi:hypothetical protein